MLKVGLTGGYATGKSFAVRQLEQLGCHVIAADKLGHAVLEPGGDAYQPAVDAFGKEILGPDGTIERPKLAAIVFRSPELLARLSSFVHPAVYRIEERMLAEFSQADPAGIAVIEAAILIETGHYRAFDRLIVTECSEETQITRGMERDRLTRAEVRARLSSQMPASEKRKFADYVINTEGPKEETVVRIREIFEELKRVGGAER